MGSRRDRTTLLICLVLVLATLAVYWQVYDFSFVLLDDHAYITDNWHVRDGLSLRSVEWAFTQSYQSNWHPLTWISLMVDAQIGGVDPCVYHVTNVLLHIVNTLLLFGFLLSATRRKWQAGAVALLFAIHPVHVESVAWVTERKDVLSTMFWLLAMLAYLRYVARRSVGRYLLVAALFALGLMSKPMLVTFPLTLLLLDAWPLQRVVESRKPKVESLDPGGSVPSRPFPTHYSLLPLLAEKIPLFAMSAASCVITIMAQTAALYTVAKLPVGARISNALVAYVSYIIKMLCPLNLVPMYPHPGRGLPLWQIVGSALLLAAITAIAIKSARRRPYLTFGWLWYVVTLIPVIGLVQVGMQSMADRYTYVPLIGLFIIAAWGVPEVLGALRVTRPSPVWISAGGAVALALMVTAYFQVGYWRDSTALAEHSLAVNDKNYAAHQLRGCAYTEEGDRERAVIEFRKALRLAPYAAETSMNLAETLCDLGRYRESADEYKRTLKMLPGHGDVHQRAGELLVKMGQLDRAMKHFRIALKLGYECPAVYVDIGDIYARRSDPVKAKRSLRQGAQDRPERQDGAV